MRWWEHALRLALHNFPSVFRMSKSSELNRSSLSCHLHPFFRVQPMINSSRFIQAQAVVIRSLTRPTLKQVLAFVISANTINRLTYTTVPDCFLCRNRKHVAPSPFQNLWSGAASVLTHGHNASFRVKQCGWCQTVKVKDNTPSHFTTTGWH